jgi:hypothetical protein
MNVYCPTLFSLSIFLILSFPTQAVIPQNPRIKLNAGELQPGTVSSWRNKGSLGKAFVSGLSGAPQVESVRGKKTVTFDGRNDQLRSTVTVPDGITGNGDFTVTTWAFNPEIGDQECMVQWGKRGTGNRCAQLNYGRNRLSGAVVHWGADLGYRDGVPEAGQWHHVAVVYEGGANGREMVYVNGKLNTVTNRTLDIWPAGLFRIGSADDSHFYSGSLASVQVYDTALKAEQIRLLAAGSDSELPDALVNLSAEDLPDGSLHRWKNIGLLGGEFIRISSSPEARTAAGRKAVVFEDKKWLKAVFDGPEGIIGDNGFSLTFLAWNPRLSHNEVVVCMSPAPEQQALQFNFGRNFRKGAFSGGRRTEIGYGSNIPSTSEWHRITYTYTGNAGGNIFRIYVDGICIDERTVQLMPGAGRTVYVGSGWDFGRDSVTIPYSGALAELEMYDFPLSERQVRNASGLFTTFAPSPSDGSLLDRLSTVISWQPGTTQAVSYDIYFGADRDEAAAAGTKSEIYMGRQPVSTNTLPVKGLVLEKPYFWRVDQLDANGEVMWKGTVWCFTADCGRASSPLPRNRRAAIKTDTKMLRWKPGKYVVSQKVFFERTLQAGTNSMVPFCTLPADADSCILPPEALEPGETYYWRVDEINTPHPASRGTVWTFRTEDPYITNDVTFFVGSDTHYGASETITEANRQAIEFFNMLPGTAYPEELGGGIVTTPRGMVLCGDLTNNGFTNEWIAFTNHYGVNGEGLLAYPVYELHGNHDGPLGNVVRNGIRKRTARRPDIVESFSNGLLYSWDWDRVHFVNMGLFAGMDGTVGALGNTNWNNPERSLQFLKEDLEKHVGDSGRPVILFQHYGWDEGFSCGWNWWTQDARHALKDVIKDYNVIALFNGHTHGAYFQDWDGYDIISDGSTQRDPMPGECFVIRVTTNELFIAHRFKEKWGITKRKKIDAP